MISSCWHFGEKHLWHFVKKCKPAIISTTMLVDDVHQESHFSSQLRAWQMCKCPNWTSWTSISWGYSGHVHLPSSLISFIFNPNFGDQGTVAARISSSFGFVLGASGTWDNGHDGPPWWWCHRMLVWFERQTRWGTAGFYLCFPVVYEVGKYDNMIQYV